MTALEKADALFERSDELLRRGRPNSSPADSRRKSMERKARRKKWTSPGPGAYDVDDSKVRPSAWPPHPSAPAALRAGFRLRCASPPHA